MGGCSAKEKRNRDEGNSDSDVTNEVLSKHAGPLLSDVDVFSFLFFFFAFPLPNCEEQRRVENGLLNRLFARVKIKQAVARGGRLQVKHLSRDHRCRVGENLGVVLAVSTGRCASHPLLRL